MNAWIAVKKLATVTPPSTSVAASRSRPAERLTRYVSITATRPPDERSRRDQSLPAERTREIHDRDGRAEPGAGGDAEEVRVGEGVSEHALVGRTRRARASIPTSAASTTRGMRMSQRIDSSIVSNGDVPIPSFAMAE